MTREKVLEARGVTVRFGGLTAVDEVDLDIHRGELVGIIGPNGAGKTTFFNALSGMTRMTTGHVIAGGRDLVRRQPHVFALAGIARTFQTPRVFAEMTVAQNVAFGFRFAGRLRNRPDSKVRDVSGILAFLELERVAEQPARVITPTRQRLLEIGMALATRPEVLLLDEVAAGLTEPEIASMALLIKRCRDELGIAVVWIEHAVIVLLRSVERVVVMHQGRVLADGSPAGVASDPAVIEAYLGTSHDPDDRSTPSLRDAPA